MREPSLVAAHMLFDASRLFPKALQESIQKKFKAGPQTSEMLIEYLSGDAHIGLCSIPEFDSHHLWQMDLTTGESVGTLPEALCEAQDILAKTKPDRAAAVCGKLARLCADGFLFLNTISFDEWSVIAYRFVENISVYISDMPFIWDQITKGDKYEPQICFTNVTAAKMTLNEHRQSAVNIANAYLKGNGWPVAKEEAARRYNNATNLLVDTVLTSLEKK